MQQWVDQRLVGKVRSYLLQHELSICTQSVARALNHLHQIYSSETLLEVVEQIEAEFSGLGPLKPLLDLENITDIFVNGPQEVWIDRGNGLERYPLHFGNEEHLRSIATRLITSTGRRLDDSQQAVDARLSNGVRIHAVIPPVSPAKTLLSIRVPQQRKLTFEHLIKTGSLTPQLADILLNILEAKLNFLISGATGSGKTALLCALLEQCSPAHRLLLVEDSCELFPQHPHVVHLEAQQSNIENSGEVTLQQLVRHALRMRPDRLVVGECRGPEIRDLLQAFNTGHSGGCGTIHANSTYDLPARLEALCALSGLTQVASWTQINSALDIALHLENRNGRRFLSQISLVAANDEGKTIIIPALHYDGINVKEHEGYAELKRLMKR
ncbi:MAG: TadA family conjugal transfer-associated ATPase [Micrococcaceae bacterium]